MPPGTSSAIVCSPPSGLAFDPRAATLLARAAHSLLLGPRARRSPAAPPSRAPDAAAHVKYPSAPDALVRFRSTSVLTPVASVLAPLVPLRRRENANSLCRGGRLVTGVRANPRLKLVPRRGAIGNGDDDLFVIIDVGVE